MSGVLRRRIARDKSTRQAVCFVLVFRQAQVQHITFSCGVQVQGKSAADQYLVFPDHYCTCQAFFYEVVGRSEAPYVSMLLVGESKLISAAVKFLLVAQFQMVLYVLCRHVPLLACL